jgi:NAD(P)-dependent dehydrogenase (short-subunit alcohol dehydrogenase family)
VRIRRIRAQPRTLDRANQRGQTAQCFILLGALMVGAPLLSFAGRCAVVTGAGRGFGEQIAVDLAALGAAVGILDVDGDAADECAARLEAGGARALGVACDISDAAQVRSAFAEVAGGIGEVDVLVNNAGIATFTPFLETTEEEFDRIFAVNYTGTFNCCREVVPGMVERGYGRIVNISSVAGKRGGGFLGRVTYSSTKAGVIGFTKALARELAPHGVTVNAVAPGAMDTEMTKVLRDDEELLARVLAAIPMGRRGGIQDVADAVCFLASDLAGYLTGETIDIDGGVTME